MKFNEEKAFEYLKGNNVYVYFKTEENVNDFLVFVEKQGDDDYFSTTSKNLYVNGACYRIGNFGVWELCKYEGVLLNKNNKIITFKELKEMFKIEEEKFYNFRELEEGKAYSCEDTIYKYENNSLFVKLEHLEKWQESVHSIYWFINARFKEVKPKEMTISEIEKELGYEIKIVDNGKCD